MKFHAECIACLMRSSLKKAEREPDPARRLAYMQEICRIMAAADSQYDSAPLVDARIIRLRRELLNLTEDYTEVKQRFNALLMELYDRLWAQIHASDDPLHAAIQLAMAGNYIDFGIIKDVNAEKLMELLEGARERPVDAAEYAHFTQELAQARELVYLTDNCGEIVLDRLLMAAIRERYPAVKLTAIVRGAPVINDATLPDALQIGLDSIAEILENGLEDIAGTQLDLLPDDVRARVERADLVIAKGQGNFESLIGCGLNVYYIFLCKCESFGSWFGLEHFSGVLMNERRHREG